jgi:hypothetical protein
MVWRRLPRDQRSAPFLGDGSLGVDVQRGRSGNVIVFRITDDPPDDHGSYLRSVAGHLVLTLSGTVSAVDLTLDLWDAELAGTITTTRGSVALRAVVLRDRGVLLVSVDPGDGEDAAGWTFDPASGAGREVLWKQRRTGDRVLVAAGPAGTADVAGALSAAPELPVAAHREWWHAYYLRSFVSVPDRRLQRFYWAQLYKLASAIGPDGAGEGDHAARVSHPLVMSTNHPELDAAYTAWRGKPAGRQVSGREPWTLRPGARSVLNIPGVGSKADQAGNPVLAWGLYDLWRSYRHTMDDDVLREVVVPALATVLRRYAAFLVPDAAGGLGLPLTLSPDYGDVEDCTYDLSLLRWASRTLFASVRRLGLDESDIAELDIAGRLVDYRADDTGVMIGRGVPLERSHPYPSHLLWVHPLREVSAEDAEGRALALRSFDHWTARREAWQGSSFTAASSMASAIGRPEEALRHLTTLVEGHVSADTGLTPNTMYRQGAELSMEAPFAAAQSLLDLLVQSHAGVLEIMPGVPASWGDVSIAGLRTDGAFVLDASRTDGRVDWVRVHSEAGEPLVVRHGIAGRVTVRGENGRRVRHEPHGVDAVKLRLAPGETAVLERTGSRADTAPRCVDANGTARPWGLAEEE